MAEEQEDSGQKQETTIDKIVKIGRLVADAGTSIFNAIAGNSRKNDQQNFNQSQAELQAAYERDLSTTNNFE